MLELYYFPTATCGIKARLTLLEKQLEFEHRVLNRDSGDLNTQAYRALNPNGVVPTLIHDGSVLIESSVIMNYIEDAFDGPTLRPPSAKGRAQMNMWLKMADEYYLPALGSLTYGIVNRHAVLKKSPEELAAYYAAIPDSERRRRRRNVVENGIESPDVVSGIQTLSRMLSDMEGTLANQNFLAGPYYSLADAALTPFVLRLEELALEWMWEGPSPGVENWWTRIRTRPSFGAVAAAFPDPDRISRMRTAGTNVRDRVGRIAEAIPLSR